MQYLGFMGRVPCRSTVYEVKWEIPDKKRFLEARAMSIKMIRSVVVLGLFWAYVLGNDARGLESLKPLADGEQPCMCQLDNGDLVLAYSRQMHPDWRLYYKISTDRGQTWSTEIR